MHESTEPQASELDRRSTELRDTILDVVGQWHARHAGRTAADAVAAMRAALGILECTGRGRLERRGWALAVDESPHLANGPAMAPQPGSGWGIGVDWPCARGRATRSVHGAENPLPSRFEFGIEKFLQNRFRAESKKLARRSGALNHVRDALFS